MAGGCLCLPLEEVGTNCSPRAVAELQWNSAFLTPTIAGGLAPDSVPTLRHLALEGEIVTKDVVSKWAGKVTLYNFYGPAEYPLAATCVINPESLRTGFAGKAPCSLRWVVDPHNQDKLLPSGASGELLIEGPILMDRYLGTSDPRTHSLPQRGYNEVVDAFQDARVDCTRPVTWYSPIVTGT